MVTTIDRVNAALDGRYRLLDEIGEGGMAHVYLALDLRHDRQVALKVLKPDLTALVGPSRFLSEIKVTASLQHPLIVPLFDSGEADGFLFYVMPFIDGESLRAKLKRERQLPVAEAVRLATDLADALQAAHTDGIVHRDVKPENIMLSRGRPFIADFGIALALESAHDQRLTGTGRGLGTPQYMSPEQAAGDTHIGPPADIYGLGCVLYEMLVGEPPFTGPTTHAVLGRIITEDAPSTTQARPSVPAHVDAVVRKCLEKVPADRFESATKLAGALDDPDFRHGPGPPPGAATAAATRPWKFLSGYASVAAVAMTILALWPSRPVQPRPLSIIPVALPNDQRPMGIMEMSADGTVLVYEGPRGDAAPLLSRRLDDLASVPIAGTAGGRSPALSPSGQTVAFLRGPDLDVIAVSGGTSRTLMSRPGLCCLRWGAEGRFVYFTDPSGDLSRISYEGARNSEIVVASDAESGRLFNGWLAPLSGGEWAVFQTAGALGSDSQIMLLNLKSGDEEELVTGRFPRFADGFLLFHPHWSSGEVMALRLDSRTRRPVEEPRPVVQDLAWGGGPNPIRLNPAPYAVSSSGTLVYTAGHQEVIRQPAWVARDGTWTPIDSTWQGDFYGLALSPDGKRLAAYQDGSSILVKELDQGPVARLAQSPGPWEWPYRPSWTSGADSILYTTVSLEGEAPETQVHMVPADGSGAPRSIGLAQPHVLLSPDGRWFVYRTSAFSGEDLYAVPRTLAEEPFPIVSTEATERQPALSRDGRFLAYASDESGRMEVYVRPFPDAGRWRTQISTQGGSAPVWSHSGRELFFHAASGELATATLEESASRLRVTGIQHLFSLEGFGTGDETSTHYDVAAGDQRFTMFRVLQGGRESMAGPRQMIMVENLQRLFERPGQASMRVPD